MMEKLKHANINQWDAHGMLPLLTAVSRDSYKDKQSILNLLQQGADSNKPGQSSGGVNAFMTYLMYEDADLTVVDCMLKKGALVNQTDNQGYTPFMYAAEAGNRDIIKLLLKQGGDLDKRDNNHGENALVHAVKSQAQETVDLLLENGANAQELQNNKDGKSPLFCAISQKNCKIVESLLEYGADIDQRAPNEDTPIICAVRSKDLEMITLLLKAGADQTLANKKGETPLTIAQSRQYTEITELLLNADKTTRPTQQCSMG